MKVSILVIMIAVPPDYIYAVRNHRTSLQHIFLRTFCHNCATLYQNMFSNVYHCYSIPVVLDNAELCFKLLADFMSCLLAKLKMALYDKVLMAGNCRNTLMPVYQLKIVILYVLSTCCIFSKLNLFIIV